MFAVLGLLAASIPAPALSRDLAQDIALAPEMLDNATGQTDNPQAIDGRLARGLVRSAARIEIRADLRAPIAETPYLEGARFNAGDTLIRFDCSRYEAELAAAKAGANAAWIDYKSKKRLLTHQAIGKDEVNLAGAQASRAEAESHVREIVNSECLIVAPFSGRVVELNSRKGEYPKADLPILVILDDSQLEVEMVVPSSWLVWLAIGQPFQFAVDETGETVTANIARIGAEVDPVSQTIRLFGKLPISDGAILSGMSGVVSFPGGS